MQKIIKLLEIRGGKRVIVVLSAMPYNFSRVRQGV